MVLVEITNAQRALVMELVHAKMDAMREADPNSWMTATYNELENMSYALYVDCAE